VALDRPVAVVDTRDGAGADHALKVEAESPSLLDGGLHFR